MDINSRVLSDIGVIREKVAALDLQVEKLMSQREELHRRSQDLAIFLRVQKEYEKIPEPLDAPKSPVAVTMVGRTSEIAATLIRSVMARVPTREILEACDKAGITVAGETHNDRMNNLAGLLRRSAKFSARRRIGWWLIELGPVPGEAGAPSPYPTDEDGVEIGVEEEAESIGSAKLQHEPTSCEVVPEPFGLRVVS